MDSAFDRAYAAHRAGRLAEAEHGYRNALASNPADADALHLFGVLRHQQGQHAEAADLVGRAVALRPGDAALQLNLGNALKALGRLDEAVDRFRNALTLAPEFPLAHYNLGNAYAALQRHDDAIDAFGRARSAHDIIDEEVQARVANATGEGSPSTVNVIESSIRFLTPDVAIEDGRVEVSSAQGERPNVRGQFTAIWVKANGKWRLASLREARVPSTIADDLAGLDWMVGDWTGQVGKATFDVTAQWNEKHTLLKRDLTVTHDGKVILHGGQRIGVDPLDGQIKSWMHDADGGHGEGVWTKHGDAWVVQATGVTSDGRRTSATNVYTYDGKNQITWKSTAGFSDGRPVPDFEITLGRTAAGEQPETRRRDGRNQ